MEKSRSSILREKTLFEVASRFCGFENTRLSDSIQKETTGHLVVRIALEVSPSDEKLFGELRDLTMIRGKRCL